MGWTFINGQISRKYIVDFLKLQFGGTHLIVDSAVRNNVVYLAVHVTKTNQVMGYTVLTSLKKDQTGYKDMHECEGPYYFDAPKRLIKKLSPTNDVTSLAWRFSCLKKPKYNAYEAFRKILA
jgi:hypothetical protein